MAPSLVEPQVEHLLFFLIEKRSGGFRPIGLLPSLAQVTEREHAEVAEQREAKHGRRYGRTLPGLKQ